MGYTGDQKREYQRRWVAQRRLKLIKRLGGKCVDCETTADLEFDHDNLELKRMSINTVLSCDWDRHDIAQELKNVVLRCVPCHKKKTKSEIIPAKHGASKYKNGCRCQICKDGHAEYRRDRRAVGLT